MGLYQRLCRTVSRQALLGYDIDNIGDAGYTPVLPAPQKSAPQKSAPQKSAPKKSSNRPDRLLRTPLLFETLEPRVLLSGDPITLAAQNALLAGLQSFQSWTANNLSQAA